MGLLCLCVTLGYQVVRFAQTFELFGPAVRNSEHGWLGPTPRNADACLMDIGKVYSWECEDISIFTEHRLGCRIWLFVIGP